MRLMSLGDQRVGYREGLRRFHINRTTLAKLDARTGFQSCSLLTVLAGTVAKQKQFSRLLAVPRALWLRIDKDQR